MNRLEVSKITCVADVRLTARIEAEADRMGLLETYTERAKQVALAGEEAKVRETDSKVALNMAKAQETMHCPHPTHRSSSIRAIRSGPRVTAP